MRILIFGGGGFVGLNIAEAALAAGHTVTLFDRALPQPALDELAAIGPPCAGVIGDVRDAAAFPATADPLMESMVTDPQSLYGLTKFAGERACARLAALWGLDVRSVRLSAVFGPWERATPARSTLSPQFQSPPAGPENRAARADSPASLPWRSCSAPRRRRPRAGLRTRPET